MMSNKGFTLIEVLVATIILFFSILTVNAAYKQYASYKLKQQKYEKIYITALSLMDYIESKNLGYFTTHKGIMNGLNYFISVKKIASNRNFVPGMLNKNFKNMGNFLVTLYKIEIRIDNKAFVLYKTEYRQIR